MASIGILARGMRRGAVLVLLLLAGCFDNRADDRSTIRISVIPFSDVTPLYVAQQKGYFAKRGMKVEFVPSVGGAAAIPGLVGGAFDVAYGNVVSSALAVQQGLEIKVVAAATESASTGAGIVVRRASGIRRGADLEGKTVAINARHGVAWLLTRAWIKATGGDIDAVRYKEIPFPQMVDALKRGQVDAVYIVGSFYDSALADSLNVDIGNPQTMLQPGMQTGQYVMTQDFIATHPEKVQAFLGALAEGNRWYDNHRGTPELYAIVAGFTGMKDADVRRLTYPPAAAKVNLQELSNSYRLMREGGMLKRPLDPALVVYQPPS